MKIFDQVLLLVFILGIRVQAQDSKYEIIRERKDKFKLPSFLCTSRWRDKCVAMGGANTRRNCTCKCTKGTNNVFGYFDNSWKCASNHNVRRYYSECSSEWFSDETTDTNLPIKVVVPENSQRKYIGQFATYYCKLESQMSYLNCYGKWEQFSQNSSVGFELEKEDELYQRSKDRFDKYNPTIYGNVIKLRLSCSDYRGGQKNSAYCVLLKVDGRQNCKVDLPTTSSPPTTSATTTQLPQTKPSTTSSTSFSETLTNEQTTAISTTKAERLTTTSSTESNAEHPMPTRRFTETKTTDAIKNSPQLQKEKSVGNDGSSGGAIGGTVGGVVALVVIVVILIFILRKRRKRCSKEKRESVASITDNLSYHNAVPANGQLEFPDDDEYSYAYTNNHPIVIKDQNGEAVTGSNVSNGHNRNIKGVSGSPPNQQAPVYSTLQDPNYAKLQTSANTSNGPSYNVLARPENQWMTRQGPVYDVLKDPNAALNTSPSKDGPIYNTLEDPNGNEPTYNTLERPENQWANKQGPVYDVLDGPNSTGAPVYSVLEGPNSNDQQVYDALEDQDPNVYGSLDSPDPHVYGALYSPTSKSVPAYDNDIYDCAGGTIIDEDTYQELNETDQRPSDIYHPVRPPRNAMAMKNMSGITQSQA